MFPLPKTPYRPIAQIGPPPSPRHKRLRHKYPSRSPPRLRGSKDYRRRAPRLRPAPVFFTQDASPAAGSSDSPPDVSYELPSPSSPLDRYNPARKTAYKRLMIDYVPSSSKLFNSPTSGKHSQHELEHSPTMPRFKSKSISTPKRTKFAPPEAVDDGVFFSSDPAPSPVITPTLKLAEKSVSAIPSLSFALDTDVLDLPSPYYRFQADSTTDELSTNLPCPTYLASLAPYADGPAFAYYIG